MTRFERCAVAAVAACITVLVVRGCRDRDPEQEQAPPAGIEAEADAWSDSWCMRHFGGDGGPEPVNSNLED